MLFLVFSQDKIRNPLRILLHISYLKKTNSPSRVRSYQYNLLTYMPSEVRVDEAV